MKTAPWYSKERSETDSDKVYHDNSLCERGAHVGKNLRHYGTDNRPLCKRCAELNDEGK